MDCSDGVTVRLLDAAHTARHVRVGKQQHERQRDAARPTPTPSAALGATVVPVPPEVAAWLDDGCAALLERASSSGRRSTAQRAKDSEKALFEWTGRIKERRVIEKNADIQLAIDLKLSLDRIIAVQNQQPPLRDSSLGKILDVSA